MLVGFFIPGVKQQLQHQVRLVWIWGLEKQKVRLSGQKIASNLVEIHRSLSLLGCIFTLHICKCEMFSSPNLLWYSRGSRFCFCLFTLPKLKIKIKIKLLLHHPGFPPPPTLQHSSWESKSTNNTGKLGFFFVKNKILAFLTRSRCGFGRKNTKLSRQGTFISSIKSQPLQVALINFILKAGWRRALAALWLNNSYYLPSFREAAECQEINIWKSREICPSITGEGEVPAAGTSQTCTFCWVGLREQFEGPI